jgi:hypothetical protein
MREEIEALNMSKPNLEAMYAVKIGQKELGLLQKQAEVAGLKYKMKLMIRNGKTIDYA